MASINFIRLALLVSLLSFVAAAPVPRPAGQFITGACTSDADCNSGCCGFNSGKCAGPVVAQERDGGCGFGDAQPNNNAAQAIQGPNAQSAAGSNGSGASSSSSGNANGNSNGSASSASGTATTGSGSGSSSSGSGTGSAAAPAGTNFITAPCTSDADCASSCCGFNSGKCAGPVVAQERDGGCGFGDAQPNDNAAQALTGGNAGGAASSGASNGAASSSSGNANGNAGANNNGGSASSSSGNANGNAGTNSGSGSASSSSGNAGTGGNFITAPCTSDVDCASGCCGFNSGKCAGPVVAQERDGGCGFGDAQPNDNAAQAVRGNRARDFAAFMKVPATKAKRAPAPAGTNFITAPCTSDADCSSGCCGFNSGKCAGPVVAQERDGGCGFGDAQPNDNAAQAVTGGASNGAGSGSSTSAGNGSASNNGNTNGSASSSGNANGSASSTSNSGNGSSNTGNGNTGSSSSSGTGTGSAAAPVGTQFITGACTSDADCASGCCGFNSGKCAGPVVAQERDGGCGFGDQSPNDNAAQALTGGGGAASGASNSNGAASGSGNANAGTNNSGSASSSGNANDNAGSNNGGASSSSGNPGTGSNFITAPCTSDADCSSGCCGFNSGKCAGPVVAQERDGGCGFGDAQPNDNAAQAVRGNRARDFAAFMKAPATKARRAPAPAGTNFITAACTSDADCASGCCGFNSGKCAGPVVAQERDGGCGFGDAQPNDTAAQALTGGNGASNGAGSGSATPTTSNTGSGNSGNDNTGNNGGAASGTGSAAGAAGTQFITGACTSDADCASGCCGFNSGKCAGPVVAQERDGGCGFGDAQPNDNAAQAVRGNRARDFAAFMKEPATKIKRAPAPAGTNFITAACTSDADCASGCCGFNSGKCAGPVVAQERDGGCGFGDAQPNDNAAQAVTGGAGNSGAASSSSSGASNNAGSSSSGTGTATSTSGNGNGSGNANTNGSTSGTGSAAAPAGTQFITGTCSADADCASGCCGFNSGKCAGPVVAQERDGGCGFGDQSPNNNAVKALQGGGGGARREVRLRSLR